MSVEDNAKAVCGLNYTDELTQIMLDNTPLACCCWNRDFQCIACNDEALKLFGFAVKGEFLTAAVHASPQFQPSGERSDEQVKKISKKLLMKAVISLSGHMWIPSGGLYPARLI